MTEEVSSKPFRSTELDMWVKLYSKHGVLYLPVGGVSGIFVYAGTTYVRALDGREEPVLETPEQVIDAINKAADAHFKVIKAEKDRVFSSIKQRLEQVLDGDPYNEEKEAEKIMRMNDFIGKDVN